MKTLAVFVAALFSAHAATAEDSHPSASVDALKNSASGSASNSGSSWSFPSLPNWSFPSLPNLWPDLDASGKFYAFIQQIADTLPIVAKMGFEVSTLSIDMSLPPHAHLRLRSTSVADSEKVSDVATKAATGFVASTIIESAIAAKRIQSATKFGGVILDVDLSVPPKVRMTFMSANRDANETSERMNEDLDVSSAKEVEH
jgi:hypothetical protein